MPGIAISALENALVAWAASRFFIEGRRTAELEVLLTTPLGARTVVAEQWKALQRLLRWPVLLMLLPHLFQLLILMNSVPGISRGWILAGYRLQYGVAQAIGLAAVLFRVTALCWLAMWFGLKARGPAGAIAWTVGLVTGGTYLVSILSSIVLGGLVLGFFGGSRGWSYSAFSSLPQVMVLLFNLALIVWARKRLLLELAGAAPARFSLQEMASEAVRDANNAIRRARHWTPS